MSGGGRASGRAGGSSARAGGGFKITKKERETAQGYIDQVIKKRWDSLDNVKSQKHMKTVLIFHMMQKRPESITEWAE